MDSKLANEQIKQLILARLQSIPSNVNISVGSEGDFTPKQLMEHVELDDEIGKKLIEIDLNYLRNLKNLDLYA